MRTPHPITSKHQNSRYSINCYFFRLRSAKAFNFMYGKVEIKAKMPLGDWLWPAAWMLPAQSAYGQWPASGMVSNIKNFQFKLMLYVCRLNNISVCDEHLFGQVSTCIGRNQLLIFCCTELHRRRHTHLLFKHRLR